MMLLGQHVVRFLYADSGQFGGCPVAVDWAEEVHAQVSDVALVLPAVCEVTKLRDALVAEFGLEVEQDFHVDEEGAEVLGQA